MATSQDVNQTARSWLHNTFHRSHDSLDAERAAACYKEDAQLVFPGSPVVNGRAAIEEFFAKQFAGLESMNHTVKTVDALPHVVYQEATISYVVKGDPEKKKIDIQGIAKFGKEADQDKISYMNVYLDPTPLLERFHAVQGLQTQV